MKRKDISEIINIINILLKLSKNINHNINLIDIKNKLNIELKKCEDIYIISDEYKEFEDKRVNLCNKHCAKNEDGTIILNDNQYVGLIGNLTFQDELNVLVKEYETAIIHYNYIKTQYDNYLNTDFKFEFEPIDKKYITDDVITGDNLELIFELIRW